MLVSASKIGAVLDVAAWGFEAHGRRRAESYIGGRRSPALASKDADSRV